MSRKIFGYFLSVLGIFIIGLNPLITGAAVGENFGKIIFSVFGIAFVVGGIVTLLAEESKLAILVSGKALEKLKKDKDVKGNRKWYFNEINRIAQNPTLRPQEKIGDMNVSPRGHSPLGMRVAWHYDPKKNILYILDLLRHDSENRYSGRWNEKAGKGEVTQASYEDFEEY